MTSVQRSNQVTNTTVQGGADWDHRLNRLLEDLQDSAVPPEQRNNATEYREFRMTSSRQTNDEPVQTVNEKWVEYGTKNGGGDVSSSHHHYSLPRNTGPSEVNSYGGSSRFASNANTMEKSVGFSDGYQSVPYSPASTAAGFSSNNKRNEFSSSSSFSRQYQGGATDVTDIMNNPTTMEFLAPANSTTVLTPGPSSPSFPTGPGAPKVERKEFYSKASYTTLIKGAPGEVSTTMDLNDRNAERLLQDLLPPREFQALPAVPQHHSSAMSSSMSSSEKRTFMSGGTDRTTDRTTTEDRIGSPLYTSTPHSSHTTGNNKSSSSTYREVSNTYGGDRSNTYTDTVTPPPKSVEGLKTPPLVRKILQQSTGGLHNSSSSNQQISKNLTTSSSAFSRESRESRETRTSGRPPVVPITYDEPLEGPKGTQYYTSTTTTSHSQRELSPVKRFPSPHPPRSDGVETPKRLDQLLATFDESYSENRNWSGDGGGPHKSQPYGPGTQNVRSVRIDDNVEERRYNDDSSDVRRRNAPSYGEPTKNVAGPPVFYPAQVFNGKIPDESDAPKKPKDAPKPVKEKKQKSEKEGGGAVPVPVCLPVCCAAPCSIV